jgi:PhnB protein
MQLNAYLHFNGQCETAFKFYEQALGGKVVAMMRYEGTSAMGHVPEHMRNRIIHARIQIGDTIIMGSDAPPERFSPPKGFALSLRTGTVAEAEKIFRTLAENGQVSMPIGKTFFAASFGMLNDRFGVPWMILCEKE